MAVPPAFTSTVDLSTLRWPPVCRAGATRSTEWFSKIDRAALRAQSGACDIPIAQVLNARCDCGGDRSSISARLRRPSTSPFPPTYAITARDTLYEISAGPDHPVLRITMVGGEFGAVCRRWRLPPRMRISDGSGTWLRFPRLGMEPRLFRHDVSQGRDHLSNRGDGTVAYRARAGPGRGAALRA